MKKEPNLWDYSVGLCRYIKSFCSSYPSFDMRGESVKRCAEIHLIERTSGRKLSVIEEISDSQP